MKKVIWVYENINKSFEFYQTFNILNLISSISLWRKFHPSHHTTLYTDEITLDLLMKLKVNNLWHEINLDVLKTDIDINKDVFWAGAKPQVLSTINEPITLIDTDFLVLSNFDHIIESKDLIYSHDEEGSEYYLRHNDKLIQNIPTKLWDMTDESLNVSFLSFNNIELLKLYSELSVKLMQEFSLAGYQHLGLIIFCEQKILKQLIIKHKFDTKSLLKEQWECKKNQWANNPKENGFFLEKNHQLHFKHYGPTKRKFKNNTPGFNYLNELNWMYNCINASKLIDINQLKEDIKIIKRV